MFILILFSHGKVFDHWKQNLTLKPEDFIGLLLVVFCQF